MIKLNLYNFYLLSGYFLQISDIHFDANYSEYGVVQEKCHLNNSYPEQHISPWGHLDCDTSFLYMENALEKIQKKFPDPDFIIWTG